MSLCNSGTNPSEKTDEIKATTRRTTKDITFDLEIFILVGTVESNSDNIDNNDITEDTNNKYFWSGFSPSGIFQVKINWRKKLAVL